jgi:uncharacterized protein
MSGRDTLIAPFIDPEKGVDSIAAALAGARDILAERIAEDAEVRQLARSIAAARGKLRSEVRDEKKEAKTKFDMYYAHEEAIASAPSHRILAILRGEAEEILTMRLGFPGDEIVTAIKRRILGNTAQPAADRQGKFGNSPFASLSASRPKLFTADIEQAIEDSWKRLLSPSLEIELRSELKERADRSAIDVFGENLRNLLLAPPAGSRRVIALDPGLRTGTKLAMLDETGKVLETATLYTERGARERAESEKTFAAIVKRHGPNLVAVGNGTGNREAESFAKQTLTAIDLKIPVVSVSEQGASVYSASEVAREEFPELDVSLRGAISIGRRLQDPLGELVKIDPKSIGVGQYQHDVNQSWLRKRLGETVDSCVNAVGVDLNTSSPQLLEHVSGVGAVLAKRIVEHRNSRGAFPSRAALMEVRGLGPRAFEQSAGFLRIRDGHPLDNSAVHPERYALVERMAADLGAPVEQLVGNVELAKKIDLKKYVSDEVGLPTLRDILAELQKPGRDPRGDFEPPPFREELSKTEDLSEGMILDGIVTNVTAFGAFVDIGVHQDGLVHVSHLSNRFLRDPNEVVKVGTRVTVKVLSVDLDRRRIALSIKEALAKTAS